MNLDSLTFEKGTVKKNLQRYLSVQEMTNPPVLTVDGRPTTYVEKWIFAAKNLEPRHQSLIGMKTYQNMLAIREMLDQGESEETVGELIKKSIDFSR